MSGNGNSGRLGKNKKSPVKKKNIGGFKYSMPRTFPAGAKEYWKRNIDYVRASGALVNDTYDSFCRLCMLYHFWKQLSSYVNKNGFTYKTTTDRGAERVVKRPEAEQMLTVCREMLQLERRFCLTPNDKHMKPIDPKRDELEDFINQ